MEGELGDLEVVACRDMVSSVIILTRGRIEKGKEGSAQQGACIQLNRRADDQEAGVTTARDVIWAGLRFRPLWNELEGYR